MNLFLRVIYFHSLRLAYTRIFCIRAFRRFTRFTRFTVTPLAYRLREGMCQVKTYNRIKSIMLTI